MARSKSTERVLRDVESGHPLVPRLAAAFVVGILSYLLVAGSREYLPTISEGLLLRGALCGTAVGLTLKRLAVPAVSALIGVAAALVGGLALTLSAPGLGVGLSLFTSFALAGALAFGLALPLTRSEATDRRIGLLVGAAMLLLVFAWTVGLLGSPFSVFAEQARLSVENVPATGGDDSVLYLRTFERMVSGQGYYESFSAAARERSAFEPSMLASPLNFRQPLMFYAWLALPGDTAVDVWRWYRVMAALFVVSGYALSARFTNPGAALPSGIALTAMFGALSHWGMWWTMSEVSSVGVLLAALLALTLRARWVAVALFVVAVALRELALLLAPVFLVVWWFGGRKREDLWACVVALTGSAAVIGVHFYLAQSHLTGGGGGSVSTWLDAGLQRYVESMRHGALLVPINAIVYPVLPLVVVLSAWLTQARPSREVLVFVGGLTLVFLLVFGTRWSAYWGFQFTPLLVALSAAAFAKAFPPGGEGPFALALEASA